MIPTSITQCKAPPANNPGVLLSMFVGAVLMSGCSLGNSETQSDQTELKIVSWNIANLAQEPGAALRGGYVRSHTDYSVLKRKIEHLDPDIIALQEIGSIAAAKQVVDVRKYTIDFESRCYDNATACERDVGDIYTAIAYKKNRLKHARVFQLDQLSILHEDECGKTRPVRGSVGVSFKHKGVTFHVPSVHIKATCKDDRVEPGTEDDCETQKQQIRELKQWLEHLPKDEIAIVAGDFNRKLLNTKDSIRSMLDSTQVGKLNYFPEKQNRTCWSKSDFKYAFGRLKSEAKKNNPEIEKQNVDPFLYTPDANQEIDFFVVRGDIAYSEIHSDQIELDGLYRFENPGSTITACDGKTIKKFEGQDRALVFSEAYPSDHCPILMEIKFEE